MAKKNMATGGSMHEVTTKVAREITRNYLIGNPEVLTKRLHGIIGRPVDFNSPTVPIEARIFMEAFADGCRVCVSKILIGEIELHLLKKEIQT